MPSDPKYLCMVRDICVRAGRMSGFSDDTIEDIKLAVDEACANVIKHAYKGDTTKRIVVQFNMTRSGLKVVIEDSGLKADPAAVRGRDLEDLKPGGLGVHFIKRVFDSVEFDMRKKTGNRLRLIKHLKNNGH